MGGASRDVSKAGQPTRGVAAVRGLTYRSTRAEKASVFGIPAAGTSLDFEIERSIDHTQSLYQSMLSSISVLIGVGVETVVAASFQCLQARVGRSTRRLWSVSMVLHGVCFLAPSTEWPSHDPLSVLDKAWSARVEHCDQGLGRLRPRDDDRLESVSLSKNSCSGDYLLRPCVAL